MRRLIITEKHSTAKPFIKVLGLHDTSNTQRASGGLIGYVTGTHDGDEWCVTWCFGHLIETCMPDEYSDEYKRWSLDYLPIVPDKWKYKPTGTSAAKRQLTIIKRLVKSGFDVVYHAADCDREGELIVREILRECRLTKAQVKGIDFRRIWYGSVTEPAIRKALETARPLTEYDGLGEAADTRQKLDWLYGINLTRAYTVYCHETSNVGRVVSPTINLIVQRQAEIDGFVPRKYAVVSALLSRDGKSFTATARIDDLDAGRQMAKDIIGDNGVISSTKKARKSNRTLLYDLTELQSSASKLYGMEPSDTMRVMQSLYEQGLVTYPRTSSNTITPDDVEATSKSLMGLLQGAFSHVSGANDIDVNRIVATPDSEDKEASHTGLCLTDIGTDAIGTVSNTHHERDIMTLIGMRMVASCLPPYVTDTTSITVDIDGTPFTATGSVVVNAGYRDFVSQASKTLGITMRKHRDTFLPDVNDGERWLVEDASETDKETTPPEQYTTASLLDTMKNITRMLPEKDARDIMRENGAGLGTSSSRDQVIATIKRNGFITSDGNGRLHPTDKAKSLMGMLPDDIKQPMMTARMEAMMTDIASGKASEEGVLTDALDVIRKDIDDVRHMTPTSRTRPVSSEVIVKAGCPVCGHDIVETKKGYTCSNCGFVIWKKMSGRQIPQRECRSLCEDGMSTRKLDGFVSKRTGRKFSCWLYIKPDKSIGFDYSDDGKDARDNYVTRNMGKMR